MVKIVFLDVDGVLNTESTPGQFTFDDTCIEQFKVIMEKTRAKIVISSTWRYSQDTVNILLDKLKQHAILDKDDDFIGHTPHLGMVTNIPSLPLKDSHLTRGDEILLWIKFNTILPGQSRQDLIQNEKNYNPFKFEDGPEFFLQKSQEWSTLNGWILPDPIELDQFVIIDDMDLSKGCYAKTLQNHFVRTSAETGLVKENTKRAIKILNSDFNFKSWRKNSFTICPNPECLLKTEEEKNQTVQTINQNNNKNICCFQ